MTCVLTKGDMWTQNRENTPQRLELHCPKTRHYQKLRGAWIRPSPEPLDGVGPADTGPCQYLGPTDT